MAKSYFSHDSNAKDDPKIIKLIDSLGLEGYGAFWVLIESLREQPNLRLPIICIPRLSRTFGITQQKLEAVINSFGLFECDGEFFYSISLLSRINEMVERGKANASKRWSKLPQKENSDVQVLDNQTKVYATALPTQCQPNAIKLNEIKLNDSKGELPTHEIGKSIEFVKIMSGKDLNEGEILNYWKAFLLNTNKTYPNENERISHFRNWMKTQVYNNRQPAEPSQVLIKLK